MSPPAVISEHLSFRTRKSQVVLLNVLVFLSGFAGLGYEMVWTRMLSVGLGHEIVSMLAVTGSFFSGLALGSWCLAGPISRTAKPGRFYAVLEMIIGFWSIVLMFLIPIAGRFASILMGPEPSTLTHWSISFLFPLLVLLPATFAMGGTLPAMERTFRSLGDNGPIIGGLYASNTFGAVAGTISTTFFIAPSAGFRLTLIILAAVNLICATGTLLATNRDAPAQQKLLPIHPEESLSAPRLFFSLFATGFLGIGYEVLVVRVMSQVLENTVYSFSGVLAVYLLGTACGACLYQRFGSAGQSRQALSRLLQGTSAACLLGMLLLRKSEAVYTLVLNSTGGGFTGFVLGELTQAFAVFFLPTAMMGATFSHLAQAASRLEKGLGQALCLNTLGCALAPALFGVILLPHLGSEITLLLASGGYLLLLPAVGLSGLLSAAAPAAVAVAIALGAFNLRIVNLIPGDRIIEHVEGVMAAVTVVEDAGNDYHLKVNNHFQMGGTSSAFSDRREAHIPLLLHFNPQRALFLGLGTGGTMAAAKDYPGLEADGVELVPEIIPMLRHFEKANGDLSRQKHLCIKVADARRYVTACKTTYDVIVSDLFHPARDGAGLLYTVEHFSAIRALLNPDGLFCQWLPLYQLDRETLRTIIRTFLHVFPEGSAYVAHYSLKMPILALISGTKPLRFPADWYEERVVDSTTRRALVSAKIDSSYSLFGCYVASSKDLANYAGNGPLNTDDFPAVIFGAPRFAYQEPKPAHELLFSLLDSSRPQPAQLLTPTVPENEIRDHERLARYWEARNRFMHTGVGVPETGDVGVLLKYVRDPLLSIVRTCPDFSPAYMPLVAMANSLYRRDPPAAKELLAAIETANPSRDEARQLRARLFPVP